MRCGRYLAVMATMLAGTPTVAQMPAPQDLKFALANDATLAARGLERIHAGRLPLRDGQVAVMDPLVYPDYPALARHVQPGDYPVTLVVSPSLSRVALAVLHVGETTPVAFEMATIPGDDLTELGPDAFFGFPVDAGMAAFASTDYYEAIQRRVAQERPDDPAFEYFMTSPEHTDLFGLPYDQSFADRPIADEPVRAILFSSGWGDGVYPAWWGLDEDGLPVVLVIDFDVIGYGAYVSPFERVAHDMRAQMGETAWHDAGLAHDALRRADRDRLAELLATRRVDPDGYVPDSGETLAMVAVRLNAAWALDVLRAHGATDSIPGFVPEVLQRHESVSAFAFWLHEVASDPDRPQSNGIPPLAPRTPALLAAVKRFATL